MKVIPIYLVLVEYTHKIYNEILYLLFLFDSIL